MNWEDRATVKKGSIGEGIVRDFLEKRGLICYQAVTEGAHAFDFLATKGKNEIFIAEVKTKARMNSYPATGINTGHLREYAKIENKHNLKVFLFFVDEHPTEKRVYGNFISELLKPVTIEGKQYPMKISGGGITLFPLASMIEIRKLNDYECQVLRANSTRKHDYLIRKAA